MTPGFKPFTMISLSFFHLKIAFGNSSKLWIHDHAYFSSGLHSERFRESSPRKWGREQKQGMKGEGREKKVSSFPALSSSLFFFALALVSAIWNACYAGFPPLSMKPTQQMGDFADVSFIQNKRSVWGTMDQRSQFWIKEKNHALHEKFDLQEIYSEQI